jgi:two-component system, cell cycle sensor histidine kinase and response regulator CckA
VLRIDVTVELSLEPCPDSGVERTEESAHLAAPGRGRRKGRILIMDDDRMVRETMRRQLAIFGYEVATAAHGEDAVIAYRQARETGQPFDAVILDLMVDNGWGGEQTLSELQKLDPGVKALVCSGSLAGPVADYERKGFCGVLSKPYAMGELRGVVEAALPSAGIA